MPEAGTGAMRPLHIVWTLAQNVPRWRCYPSIGYACRPPVGKLVAVEHPEIRGVFSKFESPAHAFGVDVLSKGQTKSVDGRKKGSPR
jgi:hypothetical protein